MEESKKKRIVIASVLKPVDETRMFGKMGISLADAGYDVHIIGYAAKLTDTSNGIITHPSQPFKRISIRRLFRPLCIFRKVFALKPALLIVTTHELLFAAVILKLVTGCKVMYDIQENYFRNILHTKAFSRWLRPWLAFYVRTKEMVLAPFINHFILAERGYERELTFLPDCKTVLENKLRKSHQLQYKESKDDDLIHLLFSGTLAHTTGIFHAIELAEKLHVLEPAIRLTIIGYCAQQVVFENILSQTKNKDFIELIGGNYLVPHKQILQEIQQADFGIISYPHNLSTENSVPTKLYEYLGYDLPILLTNHQPWVNLCSPYAAAVAIDFSDFNASDILHQIKHSKFYTSHPKDVYWEDEQLITLIGRYVF